MNAQNNTSGQSTTTGTNPTDSQNSGFNMETLTGMLGDLNVPEALKKYGGTAAKAIKGMSTTQKVIGGALLLLGATYLARKKGNGLLKNLPLTGKMGKKKNSR